MADTQRQSRPRFENWHRSMDQAWNSEATRKEFERSTGFAPLALREAELRRQVDSGYFDAYRQAFSIWVTQHLGIVEKAPSAIRAAIGA